MATNKLLYEPVPAYRKFVDNQVLTDDQLNAALDHLNYQDQLSRVLLSGVGIVCGLHISLEEGETLEACLTKGAAVTTDGNLLKVGETRYKGFRRFKDDNVKYSRFLLDEDTTMPLWELEMDTSPSDVRSLDAFESETELALDKAIVVLYLEDYLKEQEDCSPVDCDTQGKEAINNIRVLLISPEDAQKLAEDDSIFSDLLHDGEDPLIQELPPVYTPRVVLSPDDASNFNDFRKAYNVSFDKLAGYLNRLGSVSLFEEILEDEAINPVEELENISNRIFNGQYHYDFYKDLATAYNELRDLLKQHYTLCCPDSNAFPKHVLLGSLVKAESPWRHSFYPSPIFNHPNNLESLQSAFKRLLAMIKDFWTELKEDIIITPSQGEKVSLGERAIPFYYDLDESEDPASFYKNWKEEKIELVPNYYGLNYPSEDFDPLDVCLDGHDFYRIEGHVGRHVVDVHKRIQEIQKGKGLAFDIKPVAIGKHANEEIIDYDKYRVYFEDLQVVLQAWNEEQECLMQSASKFLSGFSLTEPGKHVNYVAKAENVDHTDPVINNTPVMDYHEAQPVYTAYKSKVKENYVIKGITEEQDTLGAKMRERNTISTSYNRGEIIYNTGKAVENVIEGWNADIREAAVNIPVELLGHLKETEDHKLTDIEDFTEENLRKYIEALKAQCQQVRTAKKRFQRLSGLREYTAAQSWIEQYEFVLNRIISSCCLIKKVEKLYGEILDRKQRVLDQLVLDNFIDRHPGAEHKAGVPRGGTFVLLYISGQQRIKTRYARARNAGVPGGTVVGDLCLPYICCSETPATTFVFPDQLATLRLPVNHVCMKHEDEGADPIRMEVMPTDGDIKAYIDKRELSGVIVEKENGTFFDPNGVVGDDYGKVIRFEVNGQPVEPILQLYLHPHAEFIYSEEITYRNGYTEAVVTFENKSKPFDELSFSWDFDGKIIENEKTVKFKHSFEVEPGENYEFEVKLTAVNGPCEDTSTENVKIDVPDVIIELDECEEATAKVIKASVQVMDEEFEANQDLLSQFDPSYPEKIRPVYEKVLEDPAKAFAGDMDDKIFTFIQGTHFAIEEQIGSVNTDTEREFMLKIYYELMLLYFYLQACRDERIEIDNRISDVAGGWTDFAQQAVDRYAEALKMLLEEDKLHQKLVSVRDQMHERFEGEVARIMKLLITILHEFLDQ